jgi:sterol desaturase/sphingolipid hydroxylase (fatty acid hydroxylase superfamily)
VDPAHHNRNFGSFLAVWDWAFGTLAVPASRSPGLRFGVDQEAPHRLATLLLTPFQESGRFFVKKLRKNLLLRGTLKTPV